MSTKSPSSSIGTRIVRAQQQRGTWAGGTTSLIYAYPADATSAANAQLWVATATLDQPAAYTVFAERERVQVPIAGNGIRLRFRKPRQVVTLKRLAQHRFDGARAVAVELIDGPVLAFNLIAATHVSTQAQVVQLSTKRSTHSLASVVEAPLPAAGMLVRVVYVISGLIELQVEDQLIIRLHPGDAFVFSPRALPDLLSTRVTILNLDEASELVVATLCY